MANSIPSQLAILILLQKDIAWVLDFLSGYRFICSLLAKMIVSLV